MNVSIFYMGTHQWWHMPKMHLSSGDLLLWRGHGTHVQRFWADRTRPQDPRQCHRTMLYPSNTIKLLLQYSRSVKYREKGRKINEMT